MLQLVHLMNLKMRTPILEVQDRKKSPKHLVGKKRTEALLLLEKSNAKSCVLKDCVLKSYSFYKKLNFDLNYNFSIKVIIKFITKQANRTGR